MTGRPLKVLVCGWRGLEDKALVESHLARLPRGTIIVHGDCEGGADALADRAARTLRLEVRAYPARDFGKWPGCGPRRNLAMFEKEQPDRCWAFLKAGQKVKGTANAVDIALRLGVVTRLFYSEGPSR